MTRREFIKLSAKVCWGYTELLRVRSKTNPVLLLS